MNVPIDPVLDASIENTYLAAQYVLRTWRAAKVAGEYDSVKVKLFRDLISTTQPYATLVDMNKNNEIIVAVDGLIAQMDGGILVGVNDVGTVESVAGGTAVANVLANDTYNGTPATLTNVTLSQVSTTDPKVTLDIATGKVNVAAGTAPGVYTLVYKIADKAAPTISKNGTVTVTVIATLLTVNDAGTVVSATGGTAVANVLANDKYNGATATLTDVTLSLVSSTDPKVTLEIATGKVNVAASTAGGSYTLVYKITDKAAATNTKNGTATVTVTPNVLVAVDDAGTVASTTGGTAVANVLANDTFNGTLATLTNVTLSQVSTTEPNVTLEVSSGKVNVVAGTAAGTYTLVYKIADKVTPAITKNGTVTVTVTA